jgi:hypothetical protein
VTRFVAALALLALAPASGSSPQWHPRGKTLRGDVTGDGRSEPVVVEQRGRRCAFRLVAGSEIAPARPAMCRQKPSELIDAPDPHVVALVVIDRSPGLEVLVQTGHGAHMDFADIWTYRSGSLRRYAGREPHLSYGSSVGTGAHVVGCGSRAGVVIVSDQSYPPHGQIVRHWYRAQDLRLKLIRKKAIRWNSEQPPPFPEFREPQPFPGCAKAR